MAFDPASEYWAVVPGNRALVLIPTDPYEGLWFVALIRAHPEMTDHSSPPLLPTEIPSWISHNAGRMGIDPKSLRFMPSEKHSELLAWIRQSIASLN